MLLISPHLDDAALSCAGRLLRGEVALVVTVFAGVPDEDRPLSDWDRLTRARNPAERAVERRLEDRRAWASIGQRFVQWDHPEAAVDRLDGGQLGAEIRGLARDFSQVLVPAGIGGNPHHVLVRDESLTALPADAEVTLYGELPYVAFYGWPDLAAPWLDVDGYWAQALSELPAQFRVAEQRLLTLDPALREAKLALTAHYASQIGAVTGGSLDLARRTALFDHELEITLGRSG